MMDGVKNMKTSFFKETNANGGIESLMSYSFRPIITNPLIVEITEEEYNILLAELEATNQPDEPEPDEISDEEALNIILGVSE